MPVLLPKNWFTLPWRLLSRAACAVKCGVRSCVQLTKHITAGSGGGGGITQGKDNMTVGESYEEMNEVGFIMIRKSFSHFLTVFIDVQGYVYGRIIHIELWFQFHIGPRSDKPSPIPHTSLGPVQHGKPADVTAQITELIAAGDVIVFSSDTNTSTAVSIEDRRIQFPSEGEGLL